MSVIASDTFTGSNGAAWSATWTTGLSPAGSSSTIQSNAGRLVNGSAAAYNGTGRVSRRIASGNVADAVVLFKFRWPATVNRAYLQFWLRSSESNANLLDSQSGYAFQASLENPGWDVLANSAYSGLSGFTGGSVSKTWATGVWYWVRFGVVGTTVRARVWDDGSPEPGTWDFTETNSGISSSGAWGFSKGQGGDPSAAVDLDDFSADTTWPGTSHSLDATNTLTLSQSGTIGNSRPLDSTNALTLAQTAAAISSRVLAGTNALTLTQGSTIVSSKTLAGTNALTLTQTADAVNNRSLAATNALTLTQTAVLDVSSANVVGLDSTNPLVLAQTGTIANSRKLDGLNTLALAQSATAFLDRPLDATNVLALTQTAGVSLSRLLDANTNALTLVQSAAAISNRALAASNALALTQTASLTLTRPVAAINALLLEQEASVTVTAGSSGASTGGGWNTLLDIIEQNHQYRLEEETRIPLSCPNDGEPLTAGPRGELHCRFDGWIWDGRPVRY